MTIVLAQPQRGFEGFTVPTSRHAQVPIGDPEDDEGGIGYDDEDDEDEGDDVDYDEDDDEP